MYGGGNRTKLTNVPFLELSIVVEVLCFFIIICFVMSPWFRLVSLFNGISTFVGYLMPKLLS